MFNVSNGHVWLKIVNVLNATNQGKRWFVAFKIINDFQSTNMNIWNGKNEHLKRKQIWKNLMSNGRL